MVKEIDDGRGRIDDQHPQRLEPCKIFPPADPGNEGLGAEMLIGQFTDPETIVVRQHHHNGACPIGPDRLEVGEFQCMELNHLDVRGGIRPGSSL